LSPIEVRRQAAEKEYRTAIKLDPNYATAHHWLAEIYAYSGRFEEASSEIKKALDLDPLSFVINAEYGWALVGAGKYDQALKQLKKTQELNPDFCSTYVYLGQLYRAEGKMTEAISSMQKAETMKCGVTWGLSELGYTYALAGKKAQAQEMLNEILNIAEQRYVPANYVAVVYLGLGDKDQALFWLNKGAQEGTLWLPDLSIYYPQLNSDPHFADFLRRINVQ
jgi:Tfp pilus assembly protein PilF